MIDSKIGVILFEWCTSSSHWIIFKYLQGIHFTDILRIIWNLKTTHLGQAISKQIWQILKLATSCLNT